MHSPDEAGREARYEYYLRALVRYKELQISDKDPLGHMRVPKSFVVPQSSAWQKEHWGLPLGNVVSKIRKGEQYADKREELEAAGFDFAKQASGSGKNATGWEVVEPALLTYKAQHGDLLVPRPFVVPTDDPHWPESTWGVNLGKIVSNIRNQDCYNTHEQELLDMGFDFAKQADPNATGWEVVKAALLAYKAKHGHVLVPQRFVVPDNDPRWPESTWGVKLGQIVSNIRNKDCYKDNRIELEELGFVFELTADQITLMKSEGAKKRYANK